MCDAQLRSEAGDTLEQCPACEHPLRGVQVAGLWRRAAAGVVDGLLLLVTAGALNGLLLMLIDPPPLLGDARGIDAALRLLDVSAADVLRRFAPTMVMASIYFGLFWSLAGRTPGHRVLRLRVIDPFGHPPPPWRSAVRVVGHGLGLAAGAMGWLWIGFDREKRGLADHMAQTYVVKDA